MATVIIGGTLREQLINLLILGRRQGHRECLGIGQHLRRFARPRNHSGNRRILQVPSQNDLRYSSVQLRRDAFNLFQRGHDLRVLHRRELLELGLIRLAVLTGQQA